MADLVDADLVGLGVDELLALDRPPAERFFTQMTLIRYCEELLLELFADGELDGTTHTSIGQEANAVGIVDALDRRIDWVWSNHRCHGHFLAYSGRLEAFLAELLARTTGVCGGLGGSQHLIWRRFHSSGVQGGIAPLAVGTAMAAADEGAVSLVFLGDGTLGEGVVYESMNLAASWSLPVCFVVEDNGIAQTTDTSTTTAGVIGDRARAFGIHVVESDTTDVMAVNDLAQEAIARTRLDGPTFWHLRTVRLAAHSKGDDTRSDDELARLRRRDPLVVQRPRIEQAEEVEERCRWWLRQALERARAAPIADGSSMR